ncbi:substrate-binding domain-containing protein [Afifella sp. H1R]|uniref:substrate-binding domain-containing protein n=1 Tax=Afifella sp. H1R TaxID=2908841 RepID=UPI00351CFE91
MMPPLTRIRWAIAISTAILGVFATPWPSLAQTTGLGEAIELVDPNVFRVCADPSNMPFSNQEEEGYEQKLAELFAEKLGKTVAYTYFPEVMGFVRHTLGAYECDVIMSYAQGDELVQNTNAYYQTAYALVTMPGSDVGDVTTLADPRLKDKRIGVVARTPPAANMAMYGLLKKAKPYQLMVDTRQGTSAEAMIADLKKGEIDVAALWGPLAGWFASQSDPPLKVTPLLNEKGGSRMVYRITMGVRPTDQEFKRTLNRLIRENQDAIDAILLDYGVPILDAHENPITH